MDSNLIKIFEQDEQDAWGQYAIEPGRTHVFPFTVGMFGAIKLTVAHIQPNSQDFSLAVWISEQPLDGALWPFGAGHLKPIRRAQEFMLYDAFLKGVDDERDFLQSGKRYYVNVKNLQNSPNAYELFIDPVPNPPRP